MVKVLIISGRKIQLGNSNKQQTNHCPPTHSILPYPSNNKPTVYSIRVLVCIQSCISRSTWCELRNGQLLTSLAFILIFLTFFRTAFIFDYNCAWMKGYFRYWHGTFSSHMISHAHNYANFYILELHHFIKPSSSQRLIYCIYFNAKHVKLIGELIVLVDRKQFPKTPTSYINLVSTVTKKKEN